MTARERVLVASVVRRNGAYLIDVSGPLTDDLTPVECWDAAGSLAAAKRIAVRGAREVGYEGAPRWESPSAGIWRLTMMYDAEEFAGGY